MSKDEIKIENKIYKYMCLCSTYEFSYEKHYKAYTYFYLFKESLYKCPKCGKALINIKG